MFLFLFCLLLKYTYILYRQFAIELFQTNSIGRALKPVIYNLFINLYVSTIDKKESKIDSNYVIFKF